VNKKWLQTYKQFICYKEIKNQQKPELTEDHFETNKPGPIPNEDLLDQSPKLLKTGDPKVNFEDSVLADDKTERYDYKVVNAEIWNFLSSKYGGTCIKRFYKANSYGSSECETKFQKIPLTLSFKEDMQKFLEWKGDLILEERVLAISRSKGYGDLKKRLAVCLTHMLNREIKVGMIRLWKIEEEPSKAIKAEVSKKTDQNPDSDAEMKSVPESEDTEQNSEVNFPGESLENYIGTSYKILDDNYYGGMQVFAEISDEAGQFFFQYKKEERIFVGDCEFCYKKKVLRV
jgi:hypothetical protein